MFWYTGAHPDSVLDHDGLLRIVLPGRSFGRGIRMTTTACSDVVPALGAIRAAATHAWASRDPTIHRDTVEVVSAVIAGTIRHRSWSGETVQSCATGPALYTIDVGDCPGATVVPASAPRREPNAPLESVVLLRAPIIQRSPRDPHRR